jgi:tetratricopeptide (TPR) repeat protein
MLALLLRKAVEYADASACADLVRRCELAARKALGQDPTEANARIALAGLAPLFGNWSPMRRALEAVCRDQPSHPVALHELAVLEMATGRPSAAVPIIEQLLEADPLAATFHYKRMYHLWTLGDLKQAELVAARALALWPHHPAIWMARFWTLVSTERASQAVRMATDARGQSIFPAPLLQFLHRTAELCDSKDRREVRRADVQAQIFAALEMAALGPAQSVAALMGLCALGAAEEAFHIARGYYLGQGQAAAPMRWNLRDPSITDQHRRVTQPLFVPTGRCLREHPQFSILCDDIGLSAYWEQSGVTPDFLAHRDAGDERRRRPIQDSRTAPPIVRE